MQGKFIQEINLAIQGINFLFFSSNTFTKKRCFELFLGPEGRQRCTFAEPIHLPLACISARVIHVISLRNSKHITSTRKSSCKTLRGGWNFIRTFHLLTPHTPYTEFLHHLRCYSDKWRILLSDRSNGSEGHLHHYSQDGHYLVLLTGMISCMLN